MFKKQIKLKLGWNCKLAPVLSGWEEDCGLFIFIYFSKLCDNLFIDHLKVLSSMGGFFLFKTWHMNGQGIINVLGFSETVFRIHIISQVVCSVPFPPFKLSLCFIWEQCFSWSLVTALILAVVIRKLLGDGLLSIFIRLKSSCGGSSSSREPQKFQSVLRPVQRCHLSAPSF